MTTRYDVVGIGNAIVDVLSTVTDDFLAENGVGKGVMTLIDTDRATELYSRMGPGKEISGGSAANTIAGLAMLGARTAFVGKVKDDQLGAIFAHDIRALGADFTTPMAPRSVDAETGRCLVLVSPDGERSMNTYLGVSAELSPDDIDEAQMAMTDWVYLEGYRFDGPESQEAFHKSVAATKRGGGRASITLSDPFCVERHRETFLDLIRADIDLLFANEHEITALYQTASLDEAIEAVRADVAIAAITIGPAGAYVVSGDNTFHAPAAPVVRVDATGAGDLFAAGFLHGMATGTDLLRCGTMGCIAAGEVISHLGARPETDLKALMGEI